MTVNLRFEAVLLDELHHRVYLRAAVTSVLLGLYPQYVQHGRVDQAQLLHLFEFFFAVSGTYIRRTH